MSMRITVSGLEVNPFEAFKWTISAARWADEVGPLVRSALKVESPVAPGPGSGRLRDSIRYERSTGAGEMALTFSTTVPYARYVLDGTPPHLIRPRAARALRFTQGGQTHFSQLVHHPGTRANKFPEKAIRPLLPLIQQRFAEIVQSGLRA